MAENLKDKNLKIGCGIDIGKLYSFLILGRWDYIGDAVNNASKLQARAENQVVISVDCYDKLNEEEHGDAPKWKANSYAVDLPLK